MRTRMSKPQNAGTSATERGSSAFDFPEVKRILLYQKYAPDVPETNVAKDMAFEYICRCIVRNAVSPTA